MKTKLMILLGVLLLIGFIAGCGSEDKDNTASAETDTNENAENENTDNNAAEEENTEAGNENIETLKVDFVPSRDPEEIVTMTEPLKGLLKDELSKLGYDVDTIEINVGTTYEAVGEALSAGTTDVGLIPGGTFVLYDDGADVILTATRAALSNDSENPKDWNDNKPTEGSEDEQATYYRSLMIAGPSEKGQELAKKINNGEALTWEDLNSANWAVQSTSSSAGYIYPTLWLQDNFEKSVTDLDNAVQSNGYGDSFAKLAAQQVDIVVAYADARRDNEDKWTTDFERSASIWDETNVIGVTQPIYNDTVSVSKNSETMTDDLKAALQEAFMNIAQTDAGKEVISVYSHEGYQKATAADYDGERDAQEFLKGLKQ
ncbi:PhnD/SsuA/transferrin family substrate-binding protein [Aquibacillus koreensis]|uniref:PhnD/SsuA/transferrin family substrate-binding protein n=1 Tax=Aquibacillus koreensis TaxID=279446 RepID=A0A9X3WLA9_9BACI|nr:PhnD/SsuA/transferrin family substrate-binding protein [Aquibacillus koreensis]MCT2536452.1 PhnD/SsuA/transferrin family substrate-binding protein [Aquibacillus koreensis]MDC3419459.1 PhnD/SsuA/transferrin family substrate-binding protein [Aquibacillus koreensis]